MFSLKSIIEPQGVFLSRVVENRFALKNFEKTLLKRDLGNFEKRRTAIFLPGDFLVIVISFFLFFLSKIMIRSYFRGDRIIRQLEIGEEKTKAVLKSPLNDANLSDALSKIVTDESN